MCTRAVQPADMVIRLPVVMATPAVSTVLLVVATGYLMKDSNSMTTVSDFRVFAHATEAGNAPHLKRRKYVKHTRTVTCLLGQWVTCKQAVPLAVLPAAVQPADMVTLLPVVMATLAVSTVLLVVATGHPMKDSNSMMTVSDFHVFAHATEAGNVLHLKHKKYVKRTQIVMCRLGQ